MFNSGVEAEIQNWSAALIESGNPHDVQLGASISLWVGVGMPNDRGVNQCVTACAMISRCLSWFERDAAIVPVVLQVHDSTNTQIGWSDTDMTDLAAHLQTYFTTFAARQRSLSPHTIAAYRDTWTRFLTFLAETTNDTRLDRLDFDPSTPPPSPRSWTTSKMIGATRSRHATVA